MIGFDELSAAAERVFSAQDGERAAKAEKLLLRPVRAGASSCWRLFEQEVPATVEVRAPLFGEVPELPASQLLASRLWGAQKARFVGRRAMLGEDDTMFLMGPVRTEAGLESAVSLVRQGDEGMLLQPKSPLEARMLMEGNFGHRRLTGTGVHLGAATGRNARPYMLTQFAALLMLAEKKPKLDYVVVADPSEDFKNALIDLGLHELKIFRLEQMLGVIATDLLLPVMAQDPGGYVDSATMKRLRAYRAAAQEKLGPGAHNAPVKLFLTASDKNPGPIAPIAERYGYEVRALVGRSMADRALLMAKATRIATDSTLGVLTTLFADSKVAVLDLAGGNVADRLGWLSGAGRDYAVAAPEHAEEAFGQFTSFEQQAA